jgi:hypothetical protein
VDFSYFKINKLLWRWAQENGARIVREVELSMERLPPVLREVPELTPAPVAQKPEPRPKPQPGEDLLILQIIGTARRFRNWLEKPVEPKPKPEEKPAKPADKEKTAESFDIQEIPKVMRKNRLPKSAILMERWFAGRLNYSRLDSDESAEINQEGKPYPPDMYDTTTITLDWILQFPRARAAYEYLIAEGIRSTRAKDEPQKTYSLSR